MAVPAAEAYPWQVINGVVQTDGWWHMRNWMRRDAHGEWQKINRAMSCDSFKHLS